MSKLKPCPFCGNTKPDIIRAMGEVWITCSNNCQEMRYIKDEKEAIEAWNKRVGDKDESST